MEVWPVEAYEVNISGYIQEKLNSYLLPKNLCEPGMIIPGMMRWPTMHF